MMATTAMPPAPTAEPRAALNPRPAKTPPLRVVAADGDPGERRFYAEALARLGHEAYLAESGPQLVAQCRLLEPDLVVAAARLPGLDGLAAAEELCRRRPVAVILVAQSYEPLLVARALGNDCVFACLTKPADEDVLGAALAVAARRFRQM
jgi:CheY-like chemotaxis protein